MEFAPPAGARSLRLHPPAVAEVQVEALYRTWQLAATRSDEEDANDDPTLERVEKKNLSYYNHAPSAVDESKPQLIL